MSWYAVYTKPRQEHIARENLERQSFEVHLPLMRGRRKRRGKWIETIEPMFSRYLFIRLEPGTTSLSSVRSTRGVTGLVQFGNQLVAVPESVVTTLLQTADAKSKVHNLEAGLLKRGDNVVLTDGPLANLRGIFEAKDGNARATILMRILGTEIEVAVPVQQLQRNS